MLAIMAGLSPKDTVDDREHDTNITKGERALLAII